MAPDFSSRLHCSKACNSVCHNSNRSTVINGKFKKSHKSKSPYIHNNVKIAYLKSKIILQFRHQGFIYTALMIRLGLETPNPETKTETRL